MALLSIIPNRPTSLNPKNAVALKNARNQWILRWKKEWAVRVWCKNQKPANLRKQDEKENCIMWRRKDRDPIDAYPWKETGLVDPVKSPLEATKTTQSNGKTVETTEKPHRQYTDEEKDYIEIAKLCASLGVTKKGMPKNEEHEIRMGYINQLMDYTPNIKSMKELGESDRKILIEQLQKELINLNEVDQSTELSANDAT